MLSNFDNYNKKENVQFTTTVQKPCKVHLYIGFNGIISLIVHVTKKPFIFYISFYWIRVKGSL